MDKRKKVLLFSSIGLNVLLILVVIWGFFQLNYATERKLFSDVELKLFKLEDAISHQRENNWSQPSIVIAKLEQAINGVDSSIGFGTLSKSDTELLVHFRANLQSYQKHPLDTLDDFGELSDKDKKDFEKLGDKLLKIGYREMMEEAANSTETFSTSSIISRIKELEESIRVTD